MKQTIVYIIRHGDVDNPQKIIYGRTIEVHLSKTGILQLHWLGKKIRERNDIPEHIYSSPLHRARESAEILREELRMQEPIIIEEDINESEVPAIVGIAIEEEQKLHESGNDEYSEKYVELGNETKEDMIKRMKGAFKKIVTSNTGKIVLMVSHGDPIRFLIYSLDNSGSFPMQIGSPSWKDEYLEKGEGWRLVVDEKGSVLEKERLYNEIKP